MILPSDFAEAYSITSGDEFEVCQGTVFLWNWLRKVWKWFRKHFETLSLYPEVFNNHHNQLITKHNQIEMHAEKPVIMGFRDLISKITKISKVISVQPEKFIASVNFSNLLSIEDVADRDAHRPRFLDKNVFVYIYFACD